MKARWVGGSMSVLRKRMKPGKSGSREQRMSRLDETS
jgi:hypothetical protein